MRLGLVSTTFRQFEAEDIIKIAKRLGIDAIEWSADRHIAVGDYRRAEQVKELCCDANVAIAAYGSLYHVGVNDSPAESFAVVLQTARRLAADSIRVWAGGKPSDKAGDEDLVRFLHEARLIADMAGEDGITLSFEYHPNTLFDNYISVNGLLDKIARSNVRLNWQPNQTTSMIYNIYELKMLLRHIQNVHVFYRSALNECLPLIEGKDSWQQYIKILKANDDRVLLLEHIPGGGQEALERDFTLLRELEAGA